MKPDDHVPVGEKDLYEILGRRVRQCRKDRSLTMVKLGKQAQCSQSFLSKVESGVIIPSIPMLQRIARALGVQPSSLLDNDVQSLGDQPVGRLIANEQEP
jgi:transcriptional regulator with XRE-family HTH domain